MRTLRILWRREWRDWLATPSFHLMACVYLAVTGIAFWMFAVTMAGKGLLTSEITFSGMMFWMAFLAVVSAVSTRLLGDEMERGTLELLLTAPVGEPEIILAKWGAGVQLTLLMALPAVIYPWLLRVIYPGWHGLEPAMWFSGLLLVGLITGLMTLVGMFWSQLFRRQTLAMVATFLSGILLVFRGSMRSWIGGGGVDGSTGFVAVASHVASFAAGLVDSRAIVFYLSAMAVLLFVNVRILQLARYRRSLGGVNVAVSFFLAWILAGMVNYIALLHPLRIDVSMLGESPLSEPVVKALESLKTPARVTLLAPLGEPLANAARRVVEKYRHVHSALEVHVVDEGTDLVRTRELVGQYRIRESSVLIVSCGTRYRVLPLSLMERRQEGRPRPGQRGATFSSTLDAALLSALFAVSQESQPVVYFLTGHNERSLSDFTDNRGYSEIAGIIHNHHAELRPLLLDAGAQVTNDCSVLVIAGPAGSLAAWETARIRDYLVRGGRLMLLLDSGSATGLESLLEEWGIRLGQNRVIDSRITGLLPGSRERASMLGMGEVPVIHYGAHPVTEGLDGVVTTFVLPRSVESLPGNGGSGSLNDLVDKPRVTALAFSSDRSWADVDFGQNPPRYNEGYDRQGPIPVGVAVEKGVSSEITMDIKPIRMVVIGDSQFAANRCLTGGNETLFVNALEWLLDRTTQGAVLQGQKGLYTLEIDASGRQLTFLVIVVGPPLICAGFLVWVLVTRRDRRTLHPSGRRAEESV